MASLEKISKQCLAVCEVPIAAPHEAVTNHVERNLLHGRILDTDKVDGIESDKTLTRLILLLSSEEDVRRFSEEIKQDEIQSEGEASFTVKYQKAIECELPEQWKHVEMESSDGAVQPGPAPPPRKPADQKPTGRDQYQMPNTAWPHGLYGAMSGFYQNISQQAPGGAGPMQEDVGIHENQGQMPHGASIPQHGQMPGQPYSHSDAPGQGQENKHFQAPPGFQGQDPRHGHHMPYGPVPPGQFPPGQFPPGQFPMWGMPAHFQPDKKNMPGGQNMPGHPGMMPIRMPFFMDPRTGQFIDTRTGQLIPPPGFPNMPHQPAEGGSGSGGIPQPQQPSGPPPPYNSGEFQGQGQCTEVKSPHDIPEQGQWRQSQAVSDQDEMMQKLKAKANKEYQQETMETQEDQQQNDSVFDEPGKETEEQQQPDSEERTTKIVVSGLPSTCHDEFLEMFFENKRMFSGCTVFHVDYDEESSSAVIEFEEPEAVDIVLSKRPIKVMGQLVEVDVYKLEEPVPMCTVEVTGPCTVVCEEQLDTLEMYFESEKRSGGGDLVESRFDYDQNMVLITFVNEQVAQRVEERSSHVVMKERLKVKLHVPVKSSKKSDKAENMKEEEDSPEPVKTVRVKGVDKAASRETVEFYFENNRRSGGGEIETVVSDEEEEDVLYITFKNEEDAENVSKRSHKVEGKKLNVVLYVPPKPPPSYENKILLKGLKASTTQDGLFNFIEAKSKFIPESMDYHADQEDVVMVTFETDIEFEVLKKQFEKFKLEGVTLKASPVSISNCIIVANVATDVTRDTVTYYFENERKSGGGSVDKVTMNEDDTCLVYFVDYTVIERVLKRKHTLGGQELDVKLYQDCLGRPEGEPAERKLRIPEPITLKDVDPQKIKFMNHSKVNHQALEVQLNDCYASIQWPKEKGDVILECTLTSSTKDCFKLAKHWKEDALKNFNDFMKNITVSRVPVLQDIWQKVMEELQAVSISNPEAVAIFVDQAEGLVTVVGNMKVSEHLSSTIEEITKKVMIEVEKEREKIKEVVTSLKHIETRMLLADKFPTKMDEQFPDLKVKINQNKNEIVFEGPLGQVRDARLKMYEIKNNFANSTTEKLPILSAGLYLLKQTKEHIVKKLKASRVTAVWDVTEGCLVVYSTSGENIQECLDIVQGSVIEKTIALKKSSKSVVNSENWQSKIDELHAHHTGKCHIQVSQELSKVHICATDDVSGDVLDSVKKFLRLNTVTETKVPCTKNCHRLIERHHKQELTNISKDLQNYLVQIVSVPGYGGFEVRGTEDGIEQGKSRLIALIRRVKQHEHTLQKPGLAEHMRTPKGKDNLNTIETNLPCVVSMKDDDTYEASYEDPYESVPLDSEVVGNIGVEGLRIIAYCKAYDCRNIHTVEGDMTELTAEMLINPADDKLSLTGGLGKAIVKKGGNVIKRECTDYIRDEGKLGDGEVFVSSAGNLKAEYLAHVMGPVWKGGRNKEDEMLEEAVFKCLQQASTRNLKSIAVPAISCGTYGYPVRKATSTIVEAVKNYFREVQESTVTDIYLCDMKLNTVEGFNEALEKNFGDTFHKYSLSQKPQPTSRKAKGSSYAEDLDEEDIKPLDTDEEDYDYYTSSSNMKTPGARGAPPLPKARPPQRNDGSVRIGNISVSVVKGEIGRQKVDVIVNTTAKNLDLKNGAVSASLLKAAGAELQQEVTAKYQNGIKDGELAVTSGQRLSCSMVIHSSMANWDGKNPDNCKKALHKLMKDCMNVAQGQNKSSIAFPAIGTGNLGFPRDVVASEMFTAVSKFSDSNPRSSIQDVKFIVYQKDLQSIQAFEYEQKKWASGKRGGAGGGGRQARKFDMYEDLQKGRVQEDKTSDDEHIYESLPGNDSDDDTDSGPYRFGSITVSVRQGDITSENADCIVNSSNDTLDLTREKQMKKEQVVVTSAPNLNCKRIIHVVAKETTHEWKDIVEKCLHTAEKNKMKSIAFPALGTGIQMQASDIAEAITKAILAFQKTQPACLQDVRLVIFQQQMVEDFHKAIQQACTGSGKVKRVRSQVVQSAKQRRIKTQEDPNTVTFLILALSDDTIRKAVSRLEACLEKEIHCKKFNDSIIKQMDANQVMELKAIAQQFNLDLQLASDKGHIEISGIAHNVMSASDKIHRIMRDAATLEQQKNSASLMSNLVQWNFIEIGETGQTVQPYEKDLNYKIETAYISKANNVKFSGGNIPYVLDFDRMEEFPENDDNDVVAVIRRDLVSQGAFEQPALWADMQGNLRVVVLQPTDQEYIDISQKFTASSGPGFNVVKVERVQNKTLWAQYQAKKKLLDDQNPPNTTNERSLWHGTAVEAVDNINAHGFNRSYCGKNATMYGDGVYFAVGAQYSCRNTYSRPDTAGVKRMYYCRVLTGEFIQGKQGMRVPPKKGAAADSTALYDSVVDNPKGPGMFIIFHDTQAYPEYLVSFKAQ